MAGASKPVDVSTKQERIAELARQSPEMGFTSLAYFIDIDWLKEAFDRTRKDGAVGVDGQDGEAYAANLMGNLQSLLNRAKSGTYQAPPVRRVHIPKAGSATETRPLGIPTFEDKVLQRAVVMVLEAVYEQDFKDCSFGFRPGRSAHKRAGQPLATGDGDRRRMDRGRRYPKIFRYDRPRPPSRLSPASDTRRGAATTDRQMAQRGRSRGWVLDAP